MFSYTSALTQMVSTAASFSVANALLTTGATVGHLIIPQSTGSFSSGTAPTGLNGGAALVFAANSTSGGRLWVYSSLVGWMASTLNFSTTST